MSYLGYTEQHLHEKNAYWTAREINQQPDAWLHTLELLGTQNEQIHQFLDGCLSQPNLRIILTGAGTSAFIGECLAPWLQHKLKIRVDAIATTDLVSGPELYLQADVPTLLVSFARSGNSPESVAAMDLAERYVATVQQLVITCNGAGSLFQRCSQKKNALAILLPEETHDRSFAMTSSFSSMLLAAYAVFCKTRENLLEVNKIAEAARTVLSEFTDSIREHASKGYQRVVFLGSNGFKGLAREAALKLMEMTDGEVIAAYDSCLGFRHGPKTIVNSKTLIVVFVAQHGNARQYDLDLYHELCSDNEAGAIIAITGKASAIDKRGNEVFINGLSAIDEILCTLPFVVWAQILAFEFSLILGYQPDSPSVSGTVSRVVQGVTIHA